MDILGITVEDATVRRWADWLAPARQPFFLTATEAEHLGFTREPTSQRTPDPTPDELSPELRDTYETWNLTEGLEVVWLDEQEFSARPRPVRAALVRAQAEHGRGAVPAVHDWTDILDARPLREQGDGHRFVWWPTLVQPRARDVLRRVVEHDQLPCRRLSVPEDIWRAASSVLPRARAFSGTFASGSRGNPAAEDGATYCFATVMAAAGVADADGESFENWLAVQCVAGGRDDLPGTVLVWRHHPDGNLHHAAVTLGGGWALHKPGQEWLSPRQVLALHDLLDLAPPGVTLQRYALKSRGRER